MNKSDSTDQFYRENAEAYFNETKGLSMNDTIDKFLKHVAANGKILDAGCGSGRDSKFFLEKGFSVEAFDYSPELCSLAESNIGQKVHNRSFLDIDWEDIFDGAWACASLLHLPKSELPSAINNLLRALRRDGALYMSFKHGDDESVDTRGRHFSNFTANSLKSFLESVGCEIIEIWEVESDLRGQKQIWVNAIVKKAA